jgi:hypothetical protein
LESSRSFFLAPERVLTIRRCNDGVLFFDKATRSTHLLGLPAWTLFEAIALEGAIAEDQTNASMLQALELAGLIKRC